MVDSPAPLTMATNMFGALGGLMGLKKKVAANAQGAHGRVVPVEEPQAPGSPNRSGTLKRQLTKRHTQRLEAEPRSNFSPSKMSLMHNPYADRAEADAMKKAMDSSVDELVNGMRKNTAAMRQRFADVEAIGVTLTDAQADLSRAMGSSEESTAALATFNEEMEGDFELMKKKPAWNAAGDAFLMAALGRNKEVPATTPALAAYLCECLLLADPDVTPLAAAVVGWHPSSNEMLKVFHATDSFELKAGANIRDRTESHLGQRIWKVMRSGNADLKNPHGLERTKKAYSSIMPLKSTSGKIFAVLVSGPPCVPDELIDLLCRQAGPLLERIWKREKALEAVMNVQSFIKTATLDNQQLVYIQFHKDQAEFVEQDELKRVWAWQPLMHRPNSAKVFELALKWSLGEPIGVLEVSCGTFTEMNEQLIVLLHTTADVLQCAIQCIEDLIPGDTPPLNTAKTVLREFEAQQSTIPTLLQAEIRQQLQKFDATKIFSELKSFEPKAVDKEQFRLVQGCLALLGHTRKSVPNWQKAQTLFKKSRELHEGMLTLVMTDHSPKVTKLWAESELATKGLDFDFISSRSPAPIQILVRWLQAVRMTFQISQAITEAAKPPPPDPVGDKIFASIDANNNGTIEQKELIGYLLSEFPTKVAHTLLRVLDSDNDKTISLAEWRKGWHDGLLTSVLMSEKKKRDEEAARRAPRAGSSSISDDPDAPPEGERMNRRRTNATELSAALAAKNFNADQLLGEKSGKGSGKKKK